MSAIISPKSIAARQPYGLPRLDEDFAPNRRLRVVTWRDRLLSTNSKNHKVLSLTGSGLIAPSRYNGVGVSFTASGNNYYSATIPDGVASAAPFTIEVLCAITAAPALAGFFGLIGGSIHGLIAYGGGSNRNIYYAGGGGSDLASGVDWRIDGSLQHVFITSGGAGTTMRFYRDGVLLGSGTTPTTTVGSNPNVRVGDFNIGWNAVPTGTILKAAFYDEEFSGAYVKTLTARPWLTFWSPSFDVWGGAAAAGGYTLTADAGTFTETGQAAGLYAGRTVAGAVGAFTETGQDAGLLATRTITGAAATFTESGIDAGLIAARLITGATGAIALTGQDAALTYTPVGAYSLTADAASFTETGIDAGLLATRTIAGAAGSFAETGQDTAFARGYGVAAAAASFTQTGQDAALLHATLMTADAGAFAFTGNDASLVYAPVGSLSMSAAAASFAVSGQAATLDYAALVRASRARSTGSITESTRRTGGSAGTRPRTTR
jgi:hypothetical protein